MPLADPATTAGSPVSATAAPVGRPLGPAAVVPPASVPLGFLGAAGVGLTALGLAVAFAADKVVVSPTSSGVISAVHVGVLAFLTTAVLGAVHQFGPVAAQRRLRSVLAARITFVGMVATAWLLPTGFAHGPEGLVLSGGVTGAITVSLAAWNLSGPLSASGGGVPVRGLRLSVGYLVVTVAFGLVYAIDRQAGWFPLLPHRVLAHAHIGLLGWLGLTYVSVAEKLWPMFLLAHRPSQRSGAWAVGLIAGGVPVLATGLLFSVPGLAWLGGAVVAAGLIAHLVSLASAVKHRRRALELLHAFLFTSAGFLVAALVLALSAGLADVASDIRSRLVAAEVAALIAWLGLAVIGHAHKIVPFIAYSSLRARGISKSASGRPLMFGDLFHHGTARVTLALAGTAFALVVFGILAGSSTMVVVGGVAIAATGALATANLGLGPGRAARAAAAATTTISPRPPHRTEVHP